MKAAGFRLNGASLAADPSGALWWPEMRTLVVADLHFGKGSAYAAEGGALLPPYDSHATLDRLEALAQRYNPSRWVSLGDGFHDREAGARLDRDAAARLDRLARGCDWLWLRGNHDPEPPADFGEGVLGVSGPAGTQVWPVIIADTSQARQRGLMGVTDFAALGGYAAMVFVFEGDTSGAFWMRDTPLPLRITFITAGGSVVSGTDMVPCLAPTPSDDCERYHPDGPYRFAVEHPIGPAFDIGLADAELVEVTIE